LSEVYTVEAGLHPRFTIEGTTIHMLVFEVEPAVRKAREDLRHNI
jgi:hypothetical protein